MRTSLRIVRTGVALLASGPALAQVAPVRFRVAEDPGTEVWRDACTLTLSNPADIAHARDLVARGLAAGEAIVVAPVAAGLDQINRNWGAPRAPPWHWHISQFITLSDGTVEILDGTPTGVEADPAGWAVLVCFLNRFVLHDERANCDGSTSPPTLNIMDFQCFLNHVASGC